MRRAVIAFIALMLSATSAAASETGIEAKGPAGILRGLLLQPDAGRPGAVALIIPGSGPTDHDGNSPLGLKAAPYRLLAQALAARGIASARIDKRGMFSSAAPGVDPNKVTIADYVADIQAWTAALRAKTGARCIWLLGHSEGALVAEAAAQQDADVCGLVLMSGAGRNLADVLAGQLRDNPANAPLLPAALDAIDRLKRGQQVDVAAPPAPLQGLFNPAVQGFLSSLFSLDPVALLRRYPGPVLVVQGSTDLQVKVEDARMLAAARPGVRLVVLDGVNHVLKTAPADRAGNLATYADPDLPIDPRIAPAIAEFISQSRPAGDRR